MRDIMNLLVEGKDVVHYQLTYDEHKVEKNGGYVDPARYREGNKDYHPEMLCLTGDGHAKGVRDWSKVTCERCIAKRRAHMKESIEDSVGEEKPCPKCRGKGTMPPGIAIPTPTTCRACEGTGKYPDPARIAERLNDREIAALTALRDAAKDRDGMVITRLGQFGVIDTFPRSGDNACTWTDLGKEVVEVLKSQGKVKRLDEETKAEKPNLLHALSEDDLYKKMSDATVAEERARVRFNKTRSVKNGESYRKAREKAGDLRGELRRRGLSIYRS